MNRELIATLAREVFQSAVEDEADAATLDDVLTAVRESKGEVWGLPTSALFSRVREDGEKRWLELGPVAGDLDTILALSPYIDAWAAAAGCEHIDAVYSRHGWERLLAPLGYVRCDGVMRKYVHGA